MPNKSCQSGGKKGTKYGGQGKCYTGQGAKAKTSRQGRAIEANRHKKGGM